MGVMSSPIGTHMIADLFAEGGVSRDWTEVFREKRPSDQASFHVSLLSTFPDRLSKLSAEGMLNVEAKGE